MKKYRIKNRDQQSIAVGIDHAIESKGLVFIVHGLGGFKEQPVIELFARAFMDNNYTVVRYDATNSFGESDGVYEDATVTKYFEDLEDVIAWVKKHEEYQEPFVLCGHSLGGMCALLYAEKYPNLIKALAPIATVVSGELTKERYSKEELEDWERTGRRTELVPQEGLVKKLRWNHLLDRIKYTVLEKIDMITVPILMIVGEYDAFTPVHHQKILFDRIGSIKEFHTIVGARHMFRKQQHADQVYQLLDSWIKKVVV